MYACMYVCACVYPDSLSALPPPPERRPDRRLAGADLSSLQRSRLFSAVNGAGDKGPRGMS